MVQQALILAQLPLQTIYLIIISLFSAVVILLNFRKTPWPNMLLVIALCVPLASLASEIISALPLLESHIFQGLWVTLLVFHIAEMAFSKPKPPTVLISVAVLVLTAFGMPEKYMRALSWLYVGMACFQLILAFRAVRRYQPRNKQYYWLPVLGVLVGMLITSTRHKLVFGLLLPLPAFMLAILMAVPRLPDVKFILREVVRFSSLFFYTVIIVGFGIWFAANSILPAWRLEFMGACLLLLAMTLGWISDLLDWLLDKLLRQERELAVDLIRQLEGQLRSGTGLPFIVHTIRQFLQQKAAVNTFDLVFVDPLEDGNDNTNVLLQTYATGDGLKSTLLLDKANPLFQWLGERNNYFFHTDLEASIEFSEAPSETKQWFEALQAEVFLPVFEDGKWIALLSIGPRIKGNYEMEDLTFFTAIATQLAGMVVNARLVEQLTDANDQLSRTVATLDTLSNDLTNFETIKSNFISIASHELRTPLTVTRGYVEMLLEDQGLPTTQRDLLNGIYKGVLKQEEILDSLFELARLDSANSSLRAEDLSLNDLAKEAAQKVIKQAHQRQQVLLVDLPQLPSISGDRAAIRRLFVNILQNAIKFTPDHGKVTITGYTVDPNIAGEDGIEMIIRDTGVGISKELQEVIFTRFYQPGEKVDNLSSSKFRFKGSGLGLGLALSRAIVKAHGGKIWAVSAGYDEAGLPGTEFHIFFPFERQNILPSK